MENTISVKQIATILLALAVAAVCYAWSVLTHASVANAATCELGSGSVDAAGGTVHAVGCSGIY